MIALEALPRTHPGDRSDLFVMMICNERTFPSRHTNLGRLLMVLHGADISNDLVDGHFDESSGRLSPCVQMVDPLNDLRCGLPEFHPAHDPLGDVHETPWSWWSPFLADAHHPYDPADVVPLLVEDGDPKFGPWASDPETVRARG